MGDASGFDDENEDEVDDDDDEDDEDLVRDPML